MKEGIHLGRPKQGVPFLGRVLLVVAGAGMVALGLLYHGAHRELALLKASPMDEETSIPASSLVSSEPARGVASRLRAVVDSGALLLPPPTEVLRTTASVLPETMLLTSWSLANASLLLEAVAAEESQVSELQRRMEDSPLVSGTRLLEERRLGDGRLAVRLEFSLKESSTR